MNRLILILATSTIWFSAPIIQADPVPDERQPITIQADELVSEEQTGQSVYTGNVTMEQGSTWVTGDKATVFHPERQLEKTIVLGQPAKFRRFLPEQQQWVEGHADQITYSAQHRTVLLQGNAYVKQADKNSIEGQEIFYDLNAQTVKAYRSDKQPVQVIFDPETNDQTQTPGSDQPDQPQSEPAP
jgi:lipopolysaccharide export system protein LptA